MKEQKMVSQIASLLGVPASTLRYWDTEGLVRFERSDENQYRVPTVDTILDICDVMLYHRFVDPDTTNSQYSADGAGNAPGFAAQYEKKVIGTDKEFAGLGRAD